MKSRKYAWSSVYSLHYSLCCLSILIQIMGEWALLWDKSMEKSEEEELHCKRDKKLSEEKNSKCGNGSYQPSGLVLDTVFFHLKRVREQKNFGEQLFLRWMILRTSAKKRENFKCIFLCFKNILPTTTKLRGGFWEA